MSNSITENQLDDLIHATAAAMKAQGIDLDDDKMTDLNDNLAAFIGGRLGVEITRSSTKKTDGPDNNVIQLAFDIVSADVHQIVQIVDDSYDEESIIEGLESGKLVTTTWHGDGPCELTVTETGAVVGLILSQEINGEYEDYR